MRKTLAMLFASAIAATFLALPHKRGIAAAGDCTAILREFAYRSFGPTSGCPYGYHMGWNVHACVHN